MLVYILNRYLRKTKEENLEELFSRLEIINGLIQGKLLRNPYIEVVIIDDFNRHNPLQGGSYISTILTQEESALIINFIADQLLQSLLLVGVSIFKSNTGRILTINLILTTPGLVSKLVKYAIQKHKYGLDYRAIYTSFQVNIDTQKSQERLFIKNINQDKI